MNLCRTIYYRPDPEYRGMPHGEDCGDFMPFYWEGTYYLFYLYKYCIYVVETIDFVHYGEPRIALSNGSPEEQDWHIGTGSVFYYDGVFHFYYTGFNEGNRRKEGKHEQVIMRAHSTDLKIWVKDASFALYPDKAHYGPLHWRDPQLFYGDKPRTIYMAITATEKDGMKNRNGCTAIFKSTDARAWSHYRTVYAPRTFATHECHDIFPIGNWWYMVFSNYSRWWETRYRIAKGPDGPWRTPAKDDMFDGRTLYAAKTVTDGSNRYLVGWQSARKDCDDSNPNVWGGSTLVHKLVQRPDGALGVAAPDRVREYFSTLTMLKPVERQGLWTVGDAYSCESPHAFSLLELGKLSDFCMVCATVTWKPGTIACGVMLHTDGARMEKWCQLRLEPQRNRCVMDRFNRFDGDQSFIDERPADLDGNCAEIRVIMSGNIMVAYVNDVALSTRCYSVPTGGFGIFVEEGSASFQNVTLGERSQ